MVCQPLMYHWYDCCWSIVMPVADVIATNGLILTYKYYLFDCCCEILEIKAIRTSTKPPKIWRGFVDDTFTIIKKKNRNSFLQHLNSIHPNIKFTCEEVKEDGSMPFLDILVTPAEDGSLKTSVFRKPTHTDLYMQWDSPTTSHPNTVWPVPCTIEQLPYAQTQHCCKKKNNICSMH